MKSKRITSVYLLATSLVVLTAGAAWSLTPQDNDAGLDSAVYKDSSASIDARLDDLIARMTTEEKIAQIVTIWNDKKELFDDDLNFDAEKAKQRIPHGLGQFARPSDAIGPSSPREVKGRNVSQTIELVNAIQKYATTETRLGIPILFHEEGLHGYAALDATSFPQAIALASTWDPELIGEVNAVTAREIRARGVHLVLSPVVDIARDPRWGRIEETFGEDPYLVSEMGVAAVNGLQGERDDEMLADAKVFATLKHMTGHGQPESGTNVGPAQISERELRENFFPPFEQVIRRTGIRAVMASYNEIDGIPSHANTWLLQDVLRGEWGFDGAVVSDYYAIEDLKNLHQVAANIDDAALLALAAGVDVDLPSGISYSTLNKALRDGRIEESDIDTAVRRHLEIKFRAGLFEQPYADVAYAEKITNNQEARNLARRTAQKSIVLLKNDGVLPLPLPDSADEKATIAVIGPNAAVARLGGYYGQPPETVSLLEGVRTRVGDQANIEFAQGVVITESDDWWADEVKLGDPDENHRLIKEAVKVAKDADTIILAIGDTEQTSREGWAKTHLGDRDSLDLVGEQQELFDALKALDKPLVVVLINGRPASTVVIAEQADALVEAWYLGEQGGNAMADMLFGDVNPGGKLPVTIPRSVGQLPMVYSRKPSARRGYLFGTTEPLFPFGWGLSYTKFEISEPRLSSTSIATDETVEVSVDVRNTGDRAGDEVVQLYVHDKLASVTRPIKLLKGFKRVTLEAGEHRTLNFTLGPEELSYWNVRMQRTVEPGLFDIMVGPNSVDLKTVVLEIDKT